MSIDVRCFKARVSLSIAVFVLSVMQPVLAQQTVKIKVVNNAILVPVQVDGRELQFLLDTGTEQSAIDARTADDLGLLAGGREALLKNYRVQESEVVNAERLGLGSIAFNNVKLSAIDCGQLSRALGQKVEGVLGTDVLARFVFTLNFSEQRMSVDSRGSHEGHADSAARSGGAGLSYVEPAVSSC